VVDNLGSPVEIANRTTAAGIRVLLDGTWEARKGARDRKDMAALIRLERDIAVLNEALHIRHAWERARKTDSHTSITRA